MKVHLSSAIGWLLHANSRRIGLLYLVNCALIALIGIAAALLIQIDMFSPTDQLVGSQWFGKLLTGHGMVMVFLLLIPFFTGVFGQLVLPSAIGRSDLAMRGVSFIGWLCHLSGSLLVILSLLMGAYDTGWTMMIPAAGHSPQFILLLIGLTLAALSVLLPSIAIAYSVLSRRVRTQPLARLPLFAWFLLFGAVTQILVTPVRLITLLILLGGQLWGWSYFSLSDPAGIARYQQMSWLYAGPATLGLILPAIGILFEILAARTSAFVRSRTVLVGSGLALTLLGIGSWSQHLVGAADKELMVSIGSMLGLMMIPPAALILYHWSRAIARLRFPFSTPDIFVLVVTVLFVMTGLAGASLAIPAVGIQLHNTYFSIAHLHIALAGAICGAILAGLFHFWPRWWQSTFSDRLGKLSGIGMLAGICLAFLPWTILGANGLPSSLHVYPEEYQILHAISSGGSILLVLSLLTALVILFASAIRRQGTVAESIDDSGGEFSYRSMTVRSSRGQKP